MTDAFVEENEENRNGGEIEKEKKKKITNKFERWNSQQKSASLRKIEWLYKKW